MEMSIRYTKREDIAKSVRLISDDSSLYSENSSAPGSKFLESTISMGKTCRGVELQ